jgi:hypothetical protein
LQDAQTQAAVVSRFCAIVPAVELKEPCLEYLRLAREYTEAALTPNASIPDKQLKADAAWAAVEAHILHMGARETLR